MEARHDSVLMEEVLTALEVKTGDTVVDATLGGAGHFSALLSALGGGGVLIGIDADPAAVERGQAAYVNDRRQNRPSVHMVNDNFRHLQGVLAELRVGPVDKMLFDLGWSGYQIAAPRGFSFQRDEPLLMTYGESGETAADIVNTSSEEDLANIIYTYGEERFARSIARAIVLARVKERILTTGALVAAVLAGTPARTHKGKLHPATKTFQALRIAANDEIGALRDALAAAVTVLAPEGRIAVISFHSIEDRIVKNFFRDAALMGTGSLVTKKPIAPSRSEVHVNPRARSAKLRVFQKSVRVESTVGSTSTHFSYA